MNLTYLALGLGAAAAFVLIRAALRLRREGTAALAETESRDEFLVSVARYGYVNENRGPD